MFSVKHSTGVSRKFFSVKHSKVFHGNLFRISRKYFSVKHLRVFHGNFFP
ncbi:hypothetical protein ACOSQ2_021829 [Xanthoceras sorbifolium]